MENKGELKSDALMLCHWCDRPSWEVGFWLLSDCGMWKPQEKVANKGLGGIG